MTARFLNPTKLFKSVPLVHPIEFDGTPYREIGLKKMTAGEVATFITAFQDIRKTDPDARPKFPIFVDQAGNLLPEALLDSLEADDFDRVNEVAVDFLPSRFRLDPATTSEGAPTESTRNIGAAGGL